MNKNDALGCGWPFDGENRDLKLTSSAKCGSQENPAASAMATPAPALGGTAPVLAGGIASPRPWRIVRRFAVDAIEDALGGLVLLIGAAPDMANAKLIVAAVNLVHASDCEGIDSETRWALAGSSQASGNEVAAPPFVIRDADGTVRVIDARRTE